MEITVQYNDTPQKIRVRKKSLLNLERTLKLMKPNPGEDFDESDAWREIEREDER